MSKPRTVYPPAANVSAKGNPTYPKPTMQTRAVFRSILSCSFRASGSRVVDCELMMLSPVVEILSLHLIDLWHTECIYGFPLTLFWNHTLAAFRGKPAARRDSLAPVLRIVRRP